MPRIHQVLHPGYDLNYSYKSRNAHPIRYEFLDTSSGLVLPTPEGVKHVRKFIQHEGCYLNSLTAALKDGVLRFWGEFEGTTHFEELPNARKPFYLHPKVVHTVDVTSPKKIERNTDPFVFGDAFYYSICQKNLLKNLHDGDLVLFGSEFGSNGQVKFYVDTVFVIEKEISYPVDHNELSIDFLRFVIEPLDTTENECAVNEPICISDCVPKGSAKLSNPITSIHVGRKHSKNGTLFSYVPCKPIKNKKEAGFGRPILDTNILGLRKPGARTGAFSSKEVDALELEEKWKTITETILEQGFSLGVSFKGINNDGGCTM